MKPDRVSPQAPAITMPRDRLLTVDELAVILGVSRSWIYNRAQRGDIPRRKLGGHVRFVAGEVEAWLDAHKES